MELKKLNAQDGYDVFCMLKNIQLVENAFTNPVKEMNFEEYKKWLIQQENWSKGRDLPKGYVAQTIYWLFNDDIPVGMGKIRHCLTYDSRICGGNIGYAISSEFRNQGYAKELLRLLLNEARKMKLPEIILTVEKNNEASKHVIEVNGGILFDENENRWFFRFE